MPGQRSFTRTSRLRNSRHVWLAAATLFGLAAWLALHFPHNSLWYDEALTTYVATDSWTKLWEWCTQIDIQVPLHYVVLRAWVLLLGDSEFALRLLSAFCTLLAVAGIMAIGRRLGGDRLGFAAAVLLGTMPGVMWITYEVRAYAFGLALFAWATVFLLKLVDAGIAGIYPRKLLIGYSLMMLAALYTHYTALGAFAAHIAVVVIFILIYRSRSLLRGLVTLVVLVGVGFALWLPILLTRSAADRSFYTGTPIMPDRAVEVMLGFKLLGIDSALDSILPLILGYALLIVLGALLALKTKRWRSAVVGLMITLWPVVLVAALVYFKPKLAGRYAWPAWIGFDLLAALAVMILASGRRFLAFAAVIVIAAIPWLSAERGHPPDSDFRGAFAYLCTNGDPRDVVALRDGTLFVVARYYGQRAPCTTARLTVELPVAPMTNVEQALTLLEAQQAMKHVLDARPPNVWVVSWQGDTMDPQGLAYGLLDGAGRHTVVARMFGDVRLDRYEQPQPLTGDPLKLARPANITPIPTGPTLEGVRLFAPEVAQAGDTIVLHTWWRRGETLQPDLRVSARITTLDGGWIYAQVDQPPASWKYVDDRWQPGVLALGRYELTIGPDIPPGKVAVRYVLYDAAGRWEPQTVEIGEILVK
jgi:hypothetical protein